MPAISYVHFESSMFLLHLIFQSLLKCLDLGPKITLDSKIKLPNNILYSFQCVCVVYIKMYIHMCSVDFLLGRGNKFVGFALCTEN